MSISSNPVTFGRRGSAPAPRAAPVVAKMRAGGDAPAPHAPTKAKKRASFKQRVSRKQYWGYYLASIAVSVVLLLLHVRASLGVSSLMFIVTIGRLRDMGRPAWWTLVAFGAPIIVILLALPLGPPVALGLGALFNLAFTVVLGVIPGQPQANRFGPPPGQPSAEQTAEVFS